MGLFSWLDEPLGGKTEWRCKEFPTRKALLDWMNSKESGWTTYTNPFIVYAEGRFLFFYEGSK